MKRSLRGPDNFTNNEHDHVENANFDSPSHLAHHHHSHYSSPQGAPNNIYHRAFNSFPFLAKYNSTAFTTLRTSHLMRCVLLIIIACLMSFLLFAHTKLTHDGLSSTHLSTTTTSTATTKLNFEDAVTNYLNDLTFRQFNYISDKQQQLCHPWSIQRLLIPSALHPNKDHNVSFSQFSSSAEGSNDEDSIVTAQWTGKFSTRFHLPFGSRCALGRSATTHELSSTLSPNSMLCTRSNTATSTGTSRRQTVVIRVDSTRYKNVLGLFENKDSRIREPKNSLNAWSFHMEFLQMWLDLRLADVSILTLNNTYIQKQQTERGERKVLPVSTLLTPVNVILILPDDAFTLIRGNGNVIPFIVNDQALRSFKGHNDDGSDLRALVALQTMSDGIGGKLIICGHSTTLEKLDQVLENEAGNIEGRAHVWIEHDQQSSSRLLTSIHQGIEDEEMFKQFSSSSSPPSSCSRSIVYGYSKSLLQSHDVKNRNGIARHVCFMPRQNMTENGTLPDRNFRPDVLHVLLKRLAGPLVISPGIGLYENEEEEEEENDDEENYKVDLNSKGYPLNLEQSSISGQMRVIHEECAVMLTTHGQSQWNSAILGMRPMSHVIEFVSKNTNKEELKKMKTTKSIVTLLHNVSYTSFKMDANEKGESNEQHEIDLSLSDERVEDLIKLVNEKVRDSVQNQIHLQ